MHFRTLNFLPTELSITNFHHGPYLQYDGKTFALYKIRFIFKYGLKGGLHHFINFGKMGKPIGEIIMEFEQCHKNSKKKQYFFISSMLVFIDEKKVKLNNEIKNEKIIDFDLLFHGSPIIKNPPDPKLTSKNIQLSIRLRSFIPDLFTGAVSYVGSLFEGDCREGVTYLIFDTPIPIKPGLHLTKFYSHLFNSTRPVQDERQVQYYKSLNIEFAKEGKNESELCRSIKFQNDTPVSEQAYLDNIESFHDFSDEESLHKAIKPKLPVIVGAGRRQFILSYFLLIILDIVIYFF